MFKDIIVGVTPSYVDECAVDAAIGFAQRFESNLFLVHVAGLAQGWGAIRHLEGSGETERIKAQIQEHYKEKLKGVEKHEIMVVPGLSHAEILRIARKKDADLIIMGPHTKEYAEVRARSWGMTGSTLERVSQQARCPVMIVTRSVPYGEQSFGSIVVATDLSSQAECAVNYGGQLARQYKASVTVFNCLDMEGIFGQFTQREVEIRIQEIKQRMNEEYGDRLRGIQNCEFEAWEGKPAVEILKIARIKKADLILMAHHSKETDPEKAFLGATVTQVALNSSCPTMSINRHFDLRCGMMYEQDGSVGTAKAAAV